MIIAETRLKCGARVRIADDYMDKSPEGRARVQRAFWAATTAGIAASLAAGITPEELEEKIAKANEEARQVRAREEWHICGSDAKTAEGST